MRRLDERNSKTSWGKQNMTKKSESLHTLEDSMEPTIVLNIVEGVEGFLHLFPETKAPLQQDLFSQREDMRIPSSLRDKEKVSLDYESFSTDKEKGE